MNNPCSFCDAQVLPHNHGKSLFGTSSGTRTKATLTGNVYCSDQWTDLSLGYEKPSSHNSTLHAQTLPPKLGLKQELAALTGCVSRCRSVFSPEPVAAAVLPGAQDQNNLIHTCELNKVFTPAALKDNDYCDCLDCRGCTTSDNTTGQLVKQTSFEYDHLDNIWNDNGHEENPCAVSVHFRTDLSSGHLESQRLADEITAVPHLQIDSGSFRQPKCGGNETQISSLGSNVNNSATITMNFTDQYNCNHSDTIAPTFTDSPHLSTWPRNPRRRVHHNKVDTCVESMPFALNVPSTAKITLKGSQPTQSYGSSSSMRSLHSLCCEKSSLPFRKGIDGVTFKTRMETLLSWFEEFSDDQRNSLLGKVLEECNCSQMHLLSSYMEPILHNGCPHNCQDPLSWFPPSVSYHILLFLDPASLCQASRVNKAWNAISNDPKLWMIHCRNLLLSPAGESKQRCLNVDPDGTVQWKKMYSERFRLRRNWLKGYCTVRTFEGHTQGISCVQFDETRIVSGSWDKTIKVWNRRTNTAWAALTLSGHSGTVQCLHLHNNRLVSGSSDRTIKVWDLATDKVGWVGAACRATMLGHLHTVRCLQADDDKVISGSYDHTLKIWDIRSGHCNATLRGHTDAVLCVQFDEQKVVSGSKDTSIKVWDLPDGNCKLTLYGHQAAVTCLQFDERRIISGALDRLIKIWNICTGECIQTLDWIRSEGHTGVVRHLQADQWKIVSAADDKTMKVWSVDSGARLLTLRSHTDGVTCLQFNDEVIVSGSYDKTVKLWDFSVC